MADPRIVAMQQGLRSRRPVAAWTEFLEAYSPVILQAVRYTIWDPDRAGDCFVFVCQRLRDGRYKRLLTFRAHGPTSFATWLRVVVRNLALDWHRKDAGRRRGFESVGRLPALHREIYHLCYEQGFSLEEARYALRDRFPGASEQAVVAADDELRRSMTPRQQWLLASRRTEIAPLAAADGTLQVDLADAAPDPETVSISREEWMQLSRALRTLAPADGLMLRLRFTEGVTLARVAKFLGLPDAQTADRRIRTVLEKLRKEMGR